MNVAAYIRVSTEEQAREGYSISAQKQKLEAFCISQGWDVFNFYVDEGLSAKDLERPELQRMLKHIEEGVVDCVLVYRLDRLTRSVLDLYKLLEVFEKHNCKFKSSTEVYDTTTAMGRVFITIIAALAQWERENLAERVRMGMQQKASQGKWVTNTAPFGYEIDRENDTLVINFSEAALVKEIYQLYLTNSMGMNKVATTLNERHFTNKSGQSWNTNKVRYILTNPTYKGTIRYNYRVNKDQYFEVEDAVPAIISVDDYEKVQHIVNNRTTNHPRRATSDFIFSGVAKCARCGSALAGKLSYMKRGGKKYESKSYYCVKAKAKLCDMPFMAETYITDRFLNILSFLDIHDEVAASSDIETTKKENELDKELALLQNELKLIENRRKKWQYAWANTKISDDDFTKRMNEENEREKLIRQQIEEMKPNHVIKYNPEELQGILTDIRTNWNYMKTSEKKFLVHLVTKSFFVERVSFKRKPECLKILDFKFNH